MPLPARHRRRRDNSGMNSTLNPAPEGPAEANIPRRSGHAPTMWSEWLLLTLGRGVASVAAAATFVIASRHIERADFGVVVSSTATAAFTAVLIDLGLSTSVLRTGGVALVDAAWFRRAMKMRFALGAAALALLGGVLVSNREGAAHAFATPLGYATLVLTVGCATAVESTVLNVFVATMRSGLCVVTLLIDRLVSLGSIVLIGDNGSWVVGLALSQVLGPICCLAIFASTRRLTYATNARQRSDRRTRASFVQTSASVQLQNLEVPIVGAVSGAVQGAYLGLGSRLTGPLTIAANVGSSLILRAPASKSSSAAAHRQQYLLGALPAVPLLIFALVPRHLLLAVLGSEYVAAVPVLRLVLLATAVNCFIQPFVARLQRDGDAAFVGHVITTCVVLGLGSCAIGALVNGATGGAFGMLVCQITQTAVFLFRARNSDLGD